jgi:hypothetical protein
MGLHDDMKPRAEARESERAYSGDRDRSFRLNVTVAHEMVLRD